MRIASSSVVTGVLVGTLAFGLGACLLRRMRAVKENSLPAVTGDCDLSRISHPSTELPPSSGDASDRVSAAVANAIGVPLPVPVPTVRATVWGGSTTENIEDLNVSDIIEEQ